ncbi:glycosyl transferase possibly involved in lipopolysaccharide synthesis [Nostoc sp. PCC 7524]|uniref:heterocyst development glycosyltransferase HepC n=1 Tax=Nostoc sp. (strain ATCC 29411 / PCC 7524) TaxID=28072 RepID=UPI00029F0744|nr:heterocyst development glycosyltransferase HepC [Nostoc sp. PCC 7524]AFY46349.1 glycosyl transferase possibly involved in lipopolysaccharide synthesis [Nostoc sp. PCC 7524]
MTSTIVPSLENNRPATPQQPEHHSSPYTLQWRRGQLLVKASTKLPQPYLPSLDSQQLLVECLKHSPVNLVCIDAKLGKTLLQFWAEGCEQAQKPIFLRIPSGSQFFKRASQGAVWLQFIDRVIAGVLLLLLSPIMAVLVILMQVYSPKSLFTREWRVGERGKLFRAIKFCTTHQQNSTPLGRWLRKSGLEHLPQLWNVLRGEMSLIGTRCWTLEEAISLSLERQYQLQPLSRGSGEWGIGSEV